MRSADLALGMGFGPPREAPEWAALALAVVCALVLPRLSVDRRRHLWLGGSIAAAAVLSVGYVSFYLRGGPRIIDATSYWLEARAMAAGWFAGWPLEEPAAASMGRFLFRTDVAGAPGAAVIFPPGYPALLAAGFVAGVPMLVGPLLAAAIGVATWKLGERAGTELGDAGVLSADGARLVAPVAALLGAVSAALRYHTADTMSHGLAALCFTAAIAFGLRAGRGPLGWALGAGIAGGWLMATRPVSGLALAALGALSLATSRTPKVARARLALAAVAGALPGLALLLLHQRAVVGTLGGSSQAAYYAVSDGPPGCFRYGFGAGIGCLGEHGDFVRARLADGFGLIAATGTTLRRLRQHLCDVANFELWAIAVPAAVALGWKARVVRLAALAVLLQVAAYVPFYFDGNYPGGGARFYADVLPLEHVLAAVGAACIVARLRLRPGAALLAVSLSLLGFAVRAGREHAHLRDREGGRPMFEASVAGPHLHDGSLVFLDTDHGYNLALDPGQKGRERAPSPPRIARWRGDALDWMAWDAAGRPAAFRYLFSWEDAATRPTLVPVAFAAALAPASPFEPSPRVEGESLWPARQQQGAWALPEHASGTCASGGKWLRLRTAGPDSTRAAPIGSGDGGLRPEPGVALELPARWLRGRRLVAVVAYERSPVVDAIWLTDGKPIASSRLRLGGEAPAGATCRPMESAEIPIEINDLVLELRLASQPDGAMVALDHIQIQGPPNAARTESR